LIVCIFGDVAPVLKKLRAVKSLMKKFWQALKISFSEFNKDNGLKLSASLAYYTIFSIPPLLIIIISLSGFFFGQEAIEGKVYSQIAGLVGSAPALQVQEAIKNSALSVKSQMAHVISIVILLLAATGVFAEIQDSINIIWGLRTKPKKHLLKLLLNRLMSFSMIATMGFILLVSLMVSSLLELLSDKLLHAFPEVTIYVAYAINVLILFAVISLLFATIFVILPDGKIKWRHVRMGAYFTAFLFMVGKFAIGFYLGKSHIATIYGAAGSLIIILIWVYYSSIILYFGAEFTHVYALLHGHKIRPNDYAVSIEKIIIETEPVTNEKTVIVEKV